MIKTVILITAIFLIGLPLTSQAKVEKLVLTGPKLSVTHPMAYMIEAGLLDDVAGEVELVVWDNPDQLRSLIAGGQAHFAAVPSYVASVFYNKGVPVRLLNISAWGIMYIISADPDIHTLTDLKNQEVAIAYRNDMPDLVFRSLAGRQQFAPSEDFALTYRSNFPTVVQELLRGSIRHGLVTEPLASVAILKSRKMQPDTPMLYRAVDMQTEWGKAYDRKPRIPQAGVCATPASLNDPDLVEAFQDAYRKATKWCVAHPEEAGAIVAKHIPGLKTEPVAAALKHAGLQFVSASDARAEIEHFYSVLLALNPAKIGGKLPDNTFYRQGR